MDEKKQKLKFIFYPYLIVSSSFIIGYLFLYWLLVLNFELFEPFSSLTELLFPFVGAGLVSTMFLKRRFGLLNFKYKWQSPSNCLMLIVASIAVPALIGQKYLKDNSGELVELNSIKNITLHQDAKYFKIHKAHLDNKDLSVYYKNGFISGRFSSSVVYTACFAIPLFDNIGDTNQNTVPAWLCSSYCRSFSGRIIDNKSENERIKSFEADAINDGKSLILDSGILYFERLTNSDDISDYKKAISCNSKRDDAKNPILLKPVYEEIGSHSETNFWIMLVIYLASAFAWYQFLDVKPLITKKSKEDLLVDEIEGNDGKLTDLRLITRLIPKKNNLASLSFLVILSLVFLISHVKSLGGTAILENCSLYIDALFRGELWRIFTSPFINDNFVLFCCNCFGIYLVCLFVESKIGSKRFAIIFYLIAVLANIISLVVEPDNVSFGFSSAIFGMCAIYLTLSVFGAIETELYEFGGGLAYAFLYSMISLQSGIGVEASTFDLAANLSGFTLGIFAGIILALKIKSEKKIAEQNTESVSDFLSKYDRRKHKRSL